MEIALVTGASSGMGMYAAVELARRGVRVVATVRSLASASGLQAALDEAGTSLDIRVLDVTDADLVETVISEVAAEIGPISILVNNAGLGMVGTAEQLTMDDIQAQLNVNYLAPIRLAKLVLPGMREAGRGRILTVTSVGGAVGQPFADAYCGAKFAVEGFMQSLAGVAEQVGVRVSVIEPAAVASKFVDNAIRPEVSGPYAPYQQAYLNRTAGAFANAQSPQDAGVAIADAALDFSGVFRLQTSDTAKAFVSASLADIDGERVRAFTAPWIA